MKFYELTPERAQIIETTSFQFPLIFLDDIGDIFIGKYEWRQGRSTDWIVTSSGNAEFMWEYTKVGIFAPVQETLEQKLKYLAADYVLENGGSVLVKLQLSPNQYDVSDKPMTIIEC